MKQHEVVDITYVKDVGGSGELNRFETTDRTIIPTYVPPTNIKAIDVTGYSDEEISHIEQRLAEYAEYYKVAVKSIASFDNWLEQSHQEFSDVKWRTFKLSGITEK